MDRRRAPPILITDFALTGHTSSNVQGRPDRVHNDYLNTLVDFGIIGAALVAGDMGPLCMGRLSHVGNTSNVPRTTSPTNEATARPCPGGSLGLLAILVPFPCRLQHAHPANAILAVTLLALVAGYFRFARTILAYSALAPLSIH
jgi:hypothetical protein